jgi:hypothetical protein
MKNPWMSLWLSAANQAASAARGFWMAEAERQRQALAREIAKAWGLPPSTPRRRRPSGKRAK